MRENEGTYSALVELQEQATDAKPLARQRPKPERLDPQARNEPLKSQLPHELDDLSEVGYRSHSFRFTTAESRWLSSECLQLSAQLDRPITHNTLIRVLLRVADDAMKNNPDKNDLLDKLLSIRD